MSKGKRWRVTRITREVVEVQGNAPGDDVDEWPYTEMEDEGEAIDFVKQVIDERILAEVKETVEWRVEAMDG